MRFKYADILRSAKNANEFGKLFFVVSYVVLRASDVGGGGDDAGAHYYVFEQIKIIPNMGPNGPAQRLRQRQNTKQLTRLAGIASRHTAAALQ